MPCLDSPRCTIVKTIEEDRDFYKTLYLAEKERREAAEETIEWAMEDRENVIRKKDGHKSARVLGEKYGVWKQSIIDHEKVIEELNSNKCKDDCIEDKCDWWDDEWCQCMKKR